MKPPFLIPMTIICGDCGFLMQQSQKIELLPKPHVLMTCGNSQCEQGEVILAVALHKAELLDD